MIDKYLPSSMIDRSEIHSYESNGSDKGGNNDGVNGGDNDEDNDDENEKDGRRSMEAWEEGERAVEGKREGDELKWILRESIGIFKGY